MCSRPYVAHILHLITTSLYRNTSTIFVRIWSRRCIIYRLNGHTFQCVLHLVILVAAKRGCLRTDVIQLWHNQNSQNGETTTETKTTQNPRLFQAFKFFFRLHFIYAFIRVSDSRSPLALSLHLHLTHSLNIFLLTCALVRPDRMFVYADLKSIFNDTRIFVKAFFLYYLR
jgi:hypothetical protein